MDDMIKRFKEKEDWHYMLKLKDKRGGQCGCNKQIYADDMTLLVKPYQLLKEITLEYDLNITKKNSLYVEKGNANLNVDSFRYLGHTINIRGYLNLHFKKVRRVILGIDKRIQ